MKTSGSGPGRLFLVYCCGKPRRVLPGGFLVCWHCDTHIIPNADRLSDVEAKQRKWWISNDRID